MAGDIVDRLREEAGHTCCSGGAADFEAAGSVFVHVGFARGWGVGRHGGDDPPLLSWLMEWTTRGSLISLEMCSFHCLGHYIT